MPPTNTSNATSPGTSQVSQEELLKKAKTDVKVHALQMKKLLDGGQLVEGVKHASQMLNELCTSNLSPKSYYDLHMYVTDELRYLETFMIEEFEKGVKHEDLYELVQYAQAIIPRLYLLITVGTVYIKAKEYPRRIILKDLVEMCRGVQHPLRGLFLRNYLLMETKNLLPDTEESVTYATASSTNSELDDIKDGNISDSIDFILLNFSEMNKLWVRMQYQGHTRQKEKREQERKELRLLVGTNLVRLSQLECINCELYSSLVLPKILEQVVNCNDAIAQEYLMECIIQVFPDEFHIKTLEVYLRSCQDLHEDVNIKNIIISLVDRFTKNTKIKYDESVFETFSKGISSIIQSRPNMLVQDIIATYTGLLNLAIKCYADNIEYVDKVLETSEAFLNNMNLDHIQTNTPVSKELIKLLKIPIDLYKNILTILKLKYYSTLYEHLDYVGRKSMCVYILNITLENENILSTPSDVEMLLQLINPLITDPNDKPSDYEQDAEDFSDEQTLVARLLHSMRTDDLDQQFRILKTAAKHFADSTKERMQYTLPSIVFESYDLAFRYKHHSKLDADDDNNRNNDTDTNGDDVNWDKKCDKIFKFCFEIINILIKADLPAEITFRLFLQGSIALADICYDNSENITYEYLSRAISLYDDGITTNEYSAITLIIGTCQKILHVFDEENCDALRHSCVTRAAKILKKPDQCRAVALCSHLFWNCKERNGRSLKDAQKVNECLRKCLKIAAQCVDESAKFELNVELLNYYMYYYENKNEQITIDMIKELVAKIRQDMSASDINQKATTEAQLIFGNFQRTLKYIASKTNETL